MDGKDLIMFCTCSNAALIRISAALEQGIAQCTLANTLVAQAGTFKYSIVAIKMFPFCLHRTAVQSYLNATFLTN